MRTKIVFILLAIGILVCLTTCSKPEGFVTWTEEVKLNDGRVIVVTQKKRCTSGYTGGSFASCIVREGWLEFSLPEFGAQPITWHGNLDFMILNVVEGRLYLVGTPRTQQDYVKYGEPEPIYLGFTWDGSQWIRIPFKSIPESIYDANLLIESLPPPATTLLTLDKKNSVEVNGNPRYDAVQKHIDPAYKSNFSPTFHPQK